MIVDFHFMEKVSLTNRGELKKFIRKSVADLGKEGNIRVIFCSDDYLLGINRKYLKHDYLTDIITFELSPESHSIQGELYISIDRVRENAVVFKTSIKKELHRVIFHGILHLLGYKDKSKSDKLQMKAKEEEWLKRYFS